MLLHLAEETFRSPVRPFLEPGSELTRWTPVGMLPWKEFPIIKMEGTERGPTAVSVLERISVHALQTELVPEVTRDCVSDPTCPWFKPVGSRGCLVTASAAVDKIQCRIQT